MFQLRSRFSWALPIVAIVALNASVTFANVWPTPAITWRTALSVELAIAVFGLALIIVWSGPLATRGLRWLTAGWVVMVFGHYTDVTARGLFGRDINLYWDSRHFANVAAMLTDATPVWVLAGYGLAPVALVGVLYVASRWSFNQIVASLTQPRNRQLWAACAAIVLVLYGGSRVIDGSLGERLFAEPVIPGFLAQGRVIVDLADPNAAARLLGTSPPLDVPLDSISGADVVLVFLESYGAVAWDDAALATELSAGARTLESAVASTDRRVVSAFVESPTFGASSWLAHVSLLSGVEVRTEQANQLILSQERDTLVSTFRRAGYRTVALMPGLRQAWPEGAFFQFDEIYGFDALDYTGPEFGWWTIPDQFSLARLDQFERRVDNRAPVFVFFATGTSHAPFGPVPPYQPDWAHITSRNPFPEEEVAAALSVTPDLTRLRPSYRNALTYDLQTLSGYLLANAGDDLVVIVVGDHQPPAAVGGSDLPWDVPVHVISHRAGLIEGLLAAGFRDGLRPARPVLSKLHELLPTLLTAFGPRLAGPTPVAE